MKKGKRPGRQRCRLEPPFTKVQVLSEVPFISHRKVCVMRRRNFITTTAGTFTAVAMATIGAGNGITAMADGGGDKNTGGTPTEREVITALQAGGPDAVPPGTDSELIVHAMAILDVRGTFGFGDNGRVTEIDLTGQRMSVSDTMMPSVCYFTALRRIRIAGRLSPTAIARLKELRELRDVFLMDSEIDDATLAGFRTQPELTTLGVRRATRLTDAAFESITEFPKLTSISLIELNLTDAACASLATAKQLRLVDLRGCVKIGVEGIRALRPLAELKVIRLRGMAINDAAVRELIPIESLRSVTLEECSLNAEGIALLGKIDPEEIVLFRNLAASDAAMGPMLAGLTRLRRLTVRDSILLREAVARYPQPERLVDLRLPETSVGDSLAEYFGRCVNLTRLELRATAVSDAAMETIASLGKLEYLHLQGTRLTRAGLEMLAVGAAGESLRYLNIAQCNVSDTAVIRFQESHPACDVDRRLDY